MVNYNFGSSKSHPGPHLNSRGACPEAMLMWDFRKMVEWRDRELHCSEARSVMFVLTGKRWTTSIEARQELDDPFLDMCFSPQSKEWCKAGLTTMEMAYYPFMLYRWGKLTRQGAVNAYRSVFRNEDYRSKK